MDLHRLTLGSKAEIEDVIGIDASEAIPVRPRAAWVWTISLRRSWPRCPRHVASLMALRAMIIDSWFDSYVGVGVVMLVRVVDGRLAKGDPDQTHGHGCPVQRRKARRVHPANQPRESLEAGEGYIMLASWELQAAKVGDTVTVVKTSAAAVPSRPPSRCRDPARFNRRFATCTPRRLANMTSLRDALEKLKLNDASLHYEPEVSQALGFGFRCGFLGLLHMEIVQERLEREFDQDLITTAPSVVYQVVKSDGEVIMVENPSKMPEVGRTAEIREPIVTVHLYMPQEYVGVVMTLANQKRGVQINMAYKGRQVVLTYDMPLGEIVLDFFDKLKA